MFRHSADRRSTVAISAELDSGGPIARFLNLTKKAGSADAADMAGVSGVQDAT
jgi:hypothetical protein